MLRRIGFAVALIIILIAPACAPRLEGIDVTASQEASEIFELGEAYYRNNFLPKALQHYLVVLERFPGSPEAPAAAFKVGRIYFSKKSYEKAAYYFELLISRYPDHPHAVESHYYLGVSRQKTNDHEAAVRMLGYYVNTDGAKRLNAARLSLADSLAATEQYSEALYHYAVGGADISRGKQVDVLKKSRRLIDDKLAPADLLTLLPRLPDGPIADFTRYRAAQDLLAQGRRADAAKLLREIDYSKRRYKFYDKAEKLLDIADAPAPPGATPGQPPARALAPMPSRAQYAVAVLLPLSGPRAVFGREVLHGMMQGANLFGMGGVSSYRMIVRDTEADPELAAQLVNELADDPQVLAIVGPLLGKCAAQASVEAERRAIPLIALTTREDILTTGHWTFRNFLSASEQVTTLIDYATNHQGALRFGIMYPETAQGRNFKRLFEQRLNQNRYRITAVASYPADETDFRRPLASLRAQGGFDALFLPDNAKRVALIAPQLVYYGVKNVMLLGINSWNNDDLARKAGAYLTRSVFVTGFFARSTANPEVAPFASAYEDTFQHAPTFLAAVGYDTARIVGEVMRHGAADRNDLRRRLFRVHSFAGVTGELTIDETRDTRRRLYLLRVGKSRIEELL